MAEIYYHILALWPDEDGFYQKEDFEHYFPPTVVLNVNEQLQDGKQKTTSLELNMFFDEEFDLIEYRC